MQFAGSARIVGDPKTIAARDQPPGRSALERRGRELAAIRGDAGGCHVARRVCVSRLRNYGTPYIVSPLRRSPRPRGARREKCFVARAEGRDQPRPRSGDRLWDRSAGLGRAYAARRVHAGSAAVAWTYRLPPHPVIRVTFPLRHVYRPE
jgi:hypothetical protein